MITSKRTKFRTGCLRNTSLEHQCYSKLTNTFAQLVPQSTRMNQRFVENKQRVLSGFDKVRSMSASWISNSWCMKCAIFYVSLNWIVSIEVSFWTLKLLNCEKWFNDSTSAENAWSYAIFICWWGWCWVGWLHIHLAEMEENVWHHNSPVECT